MARRGINYSLNRLHESLAALGSPHRHLPPVLHIAGTNGKGSVAHYLTQGLMAMNKRVLTYTSPHILHYNERFKINDVPITDMQFAHLFERIHIADQKDELSEYECLTLMAFELSIQVKPDYLILETGLGGRLDATNAVPNSLAIITDIGLDHTELLGDSLASIATEKAGIIKPNSHVFTHMDHPTPVMEAIKHKAKKEQATLHWAPLKQSIHERNKALAVDVLNHLDHLPQASTHKLMAAIPPPFGRLTPFTYRGSDCFIDVGHNLAAASAILNLKPTLSEWVIGMQSTKDFNGVISYLIESNINVKLCEFDPVRCVRHQDLLPGISDQVSLWYPNDDINDQTLFFGSFYFIDLLLKGGYHASQ